MRASRSLTFNITYGVKLRKIIFKRDSLCFTGAGLLSQTDSSNIIRFKMRVLNFCYLPRHHFVTSSLSSSSSLSYSYAFLLPAILLHNSVNTMKDKKNKRPTENRALVLQPASGYHSTSTKPQRNTNTHRTRAIQPMK